LNVTTVQEKEVFIIHLSYISKNLYQNLNKNTTKSVSSFLFIIPLTINRFNDSFLMT